jgi:hypothetical protein
MWAVLWNAWLFGHTVKITPELGFCWATDTFDRWYEYGIYHNAGVSDVNTRMFNKMNYTNKVPNDFQLKNINKLYANYHYAKLVKKTISKNYEYY